MIQDQTAARVTKKILIGVGYEKCGTTTAHDILCGSKLISAPLRKETMFFSRDFDKGLDYYMSLYPENDSAPFMLDITPSYHAHDASYKRVRQTSNDYLALIFIRDPIRRAFSLYWHNIVNHFASGQSTAQRPSHNVFANPFQKNFWEVASTFHHYA